MKNNLKITAILILSAFLLIFFVSCAQNTETEERFDTDFISGEPELELNMETFRMGSPFINEYTPEVGYSDGGDKMLARYKAAEEKFGITIEFLNGDCCSQGGLLSNAASDIPEKIPDIIDVPGDDAYSMYLAGILFPFDEMETIDINNEKFGGLTYITQGTSWGGHRWCVYPYNWQMIPQYVGTIIFNNANLRSFALSDAPYEMIENGKWVWSNFEDLIQKTTYQVEGKTQNSLAISNPEWFCETAVFSNGGKIVNVTDDGFFFDLGSAKALEALNWTAELITKGGCTIGGVTGALNDGYTFHYDQAYHATLDEGERSYPIALQDYGIVPFPWGPSGEYGSCSAGIHGNRRFIAAINLSYNEMDEVGTVLDFLFDPLDGDEKEAWKTTLNYILHHQEDIDNYIWMCENVNYLYDHELGSAKNKVYEGLTAILNGQKSVSEFIDSVSASANENLAEAFADQNK